jgi:hypothetical protein
LDPLGWGGGLSSWAGVYTVNFCKTITIEDRCLAGHLVRPMSNIKVDSAMTITLLYFMRLSMSQHCIAQIGLFGSSGSDWKHRWRWNSGFVGGAGPTDECTSWIMFQGTRMVILEMVLHQVGARRHLPPRTFVLEMVSLCHRRIGLDQVYPTSQDF